MKTYRTLLTPFFDQIQAEHLILTPTNRLARKLQTEFTQYQLQKGMTTWTTQHFIAVKSWFNIIWQQALQAGYNSQHTLLNAEQSHALWQQVLGENSRLANQIEKTWDLVAQWNIDLHELQQTDNPDQALFCEWLSTYLKQGKQKKWLDQAQLLSFLTQQLPNQYLPKFKHIYLVGFNQLGLSPAINEFLQRLQKNFCNITEIQLSNQTSSQTRVAFADSLLELQQMATWAKQTHSQHPEQEIICVIPQLTEIREEVVHTFYKTFALDRQITGHLPFNIAGGIPLLQLPMIQCAFHWFNMLNEQIAINTISFILNSPFWRTETIEKNIYPLLEYRLLQEEKATFTLANLLEFSQQFDCPLLIDTLTQIIQYKNLAKASPNQWVIYFSDFLNLVGWPGIQPLTSSEYQTLQNWQQLLEKFSELDYVLENITQDFAFKKLNALANRTLFQAETIGATIHVVGLLEAAGLVCDKMWVMSMNDTIWPTQQGRNPFIPAQLQQNLNMPHNSAQHEWQYCYSITQQFLQAADEIIFSYAERNGDEILAVSPLIKHLPEIKFDTLANKTECFASVLETIQDSQGPLFNMEHAVGGSDILKKQAACPFRAFTEYRLYAKLPDPAQPGFSAKIKGILLHKCLELFWQQIKNKDNLIALNDNDLNSLIQEAINKTCKNPAIFHYPRQLVELEKSRLQKIIFNWLSFEKNREDFEVVGCEIKKEITTASLNFTIRLDRIDKINQQYVLLDYKSAIPQANGWLDERIDEPQLPLYAITHNYPVHGIAFASLAPGQFKFSGLTAGKNILPGCKQYIEWSELLNNWEKDLTQLAQEFAQGYAKVNPKKGEQTCRQCQLKTFCRVQF